METVVAENLSVTYPGGMRALHRVSFAVDEGSITAYLGPNGAGKTTTINVLTTALLPTAGEAWVCGYSVRTEKEAIRRLIGVATQDVIVDPLLSPLGNLRFFAAIFGVPGRERRAIIDELIERFDLLPQVRTTVMALSGGQCKRLQLAITLLRRPRVLFLDEPTQGLDPVGKEVLFGYLQQLGDSGVTIFYSSNEMEHLEKLCDRVLFLSRGRLIADEIMEDFVRRFGGGDIIVLEYEGDLSAEALATLGRLAKVRSTTPLTLAVEDARATLPAVIGVLARHGVDVRGVDIRRPCLNDAFLSLVREDYDGVR